MRYTFSFLIIKKYYRYSDYTCTAVPGSYLIHELFAAYLLAMVLANGATVEHMR